MAPLPELTSHVNCAVKLPHFTEAPLPCGGTFGVHCGPRVSLLTYGRANCPYPAASQSASTNWQISKTAPGLLTGRIFSD